MKQYMMVVGMEVITYNEIDKMMKMILQPLTNVKTKPDTSSVKGILSFGKQIAKGMVTEEHRSTIYVPCEQCYPWKTDGYKIGRHMVLDVNMDDTTGGIDVENK